MSTSEKLEWRIDTRLTSYVGWGCWRTDQQVKVEAGEPYAQAGPLPSCLQSSANRSRWDSTLIHSFDLTAANAHYGNCIANLLHGKEREVYRDRGYVGRSEVIAEVAPKARDLTNERVRQRDVDNPAHRRNRKKAKIRSRVEHPFHTITRVFGLCKTRLRGMLDNTNRLYVTCALANLHRVRHPFAS